MLVQRVLMPGSGRESWTLLGDDGAVVEPAERYLAYLTAIERSPNTVRAYAISLKLWFEFLQHAATSWDEAGVEDVARFVAWLRAPAGNVIVLADGSGVREAATVNRYLAGVFGFYDHHARTGLRVAAELVSWRRISRGSYKPFLHHVTKGRPIPVRPVKLHVPRRAPRTLEPGQIVASLAACEHLRDRFLLSLLAETGMRVGQAPGLRHADFVSRKREVHIVPRPDNANGARAKLRSAAVVPVSTPLVRLYSEYMHVEYGDLDSDYVFVNLFAGPIGAAMTYPVVHQLIGRIAARTGIGFTAHMLRHSHRHGPPGRADRGGRAAAHPPVLDDHEPGLRPSGRGRHPRGAVQGRGVAGGGPVTGAMPAGQDRPRLQAVSGEGAVLDGQWASDHWDAGRLGIPARRGRGTARFGGISQSWLRGPVKRWSRFRLATGCAFATIDAGALALTRFSQFLGTRQPDAGDASAITRPVLEDYLSWLVTQGYSASTRALSLSMIRVFFDACHRHGWLPGLAANATIYVEELPFHHDQIARFIPESVMAQLESGQALPKIPHTTTRNLIVVLIETGLRGGDACNLPFSPVLTDSSGWPCLRYEAVKVRSEQLIPLSAKAAAAISAQQDYVRQRWPAGSPWLFPGMTGNDDGSKPYSHSALIQQLRRWQRVIGLRDEAGQPVIVTGHQFRHTLGTRLINSGVPQHVVQRLLGHASPHMTSHYAKVHDATIREAFDRYQAQRINISGEPIGYDPDAPTASAEWVKHNLNRVRDSLPNGYCGRPAQQDCPHPNACLTCPDFQTTPEFLQIHRRQATTNSHLIAQANANGQLRLAQNLRRVQANLERIIPALEALQDGDPGDDPR